jgi:hypothetical protein
MPPVSPAEAADIVALSRITTPGGGAMRSRYSLAVIVCMGLLASAALAPPAGAKHFRLLSFKPCNRVLVAADFLDNLEEVSPKSSISAGGTTADTSTCKDASTEEGDPGGVKHFTNGELGVECLANVIKQAGEGATPHPGGCWRIDTATVLFAYGHEVNKLASKLAKGEKAAHWPAGFGRHVLPGVGDRAEFGYSPGSGDGLGYLQEDNATLFVETIEGAKPSLISLLRDAASTL